MADSDDEKPPARPRINLRAIATITAAFTSVSIYLTGGTLVRTTYLFIGACVLGAFLWKLTPVDIKINPSTKKLFARVTFARTRAAILTIATWAGCGVAVFTLLGAAFAYLTSAEDFVAEVGVWAVWGTLVPALGGMAFWTVQRIYKDALYNWNRDRGLFVVDDPRRA